MMVHKAEPFDYTTRYQQIMASPDPAEQKAVGRAVSGPGETVWDTGGLGTAHQTNLRKFGQNPNLRSFLLGTDKRKNPVLVDNA